MSDIFVSYASVDREKAKAFAEMLSGRGWSVWWDRVIPPGREFDEVIEEALDAASCVVVLWSKASVASRWVKTESAEAMRRKALIPVLIDDTKIPLEFRRLQAADLSQWHGEPDHPELLNFMRSLETHVRSARNPVPPASGANREASASSESVPTQTAFRGAPTESQPQVPLRQGISQNALIALGALVAVVVGGAAYSVFNAKEGAAVRDNAGAEHQRTTKEIVQKAADERRAAEDALAEARTAREEVLRETARRKAEDDSAAAVTRARNVLTEQNRTERADGLPDRVTRVPNQDAPPRVTNIGGMWRDATGGIHQIRQSGSQIEVVTANPGNGYQSQGRGVISGQQVTTDFQTNLPSTGRAIGTLSADGQSISGTVTDSRLGQYGLMIYR